MELYMQEQINWEASLLSSRTGIAGTPWTPPGVVNWKEMTIFPRNPELFLAKEFVRPIQVDCPYKSDQGYLDTQFRLLREDFMKPMREGIQEFKKWQHTKRNKSRPTTVRVYENVRIQSGANKPSQRDEGETKGRKRIIIPTQQKYVDLSSTTEDSSSRFLINGSLLLFSPNLASGGTDFTSVKLATVVRSSDADDDLLKTKGILNVNFVPDGPTWKINPKSTYTVLESVAFFEAYRFALENLQVLNMRDWPLAKYILDPSIPFQSINSDVSFEQKCTYGRSNLQFKNGIINSSPRI